MTLAGPPTLAVEGLTILLRGPRGAVPAVEDVSFEICQGRTLGIVGESGAGKSLTAMAILGLLPEAQVHGSIRLAGEELAGLDPSRLAGVRGKAVGMVFQEPRQSFNPAFTVGEQIVETLRRHEGLGRRAAHIQAVELLRLAGIERPDERAGDYPHTFSGGMLQRAMIAMAIACRPLLLIADEPTTALDVTVQAQILALLKRLQETIGMAMLFVSHDMGLIAEVCDDVVVMYAGQIVERASTLDLFDRPRHPYTEGLLRSVPGIVPRGTELYGIPGSMPAAGRMPAGCRFHPRCPFVIDACSRGPLVLESISGGQEARCLRARDLALEGVAA